MVLLAVIVSYEFGKHLSKMPFADGDDAIENILVLA
jgi:hypothetical protein